MSPDTIIPGMANPQSWNRYSYVTNNPLRYTDPTGHKPACGVYGEECSDEEIDALTGGTTTGGWVGGGHDDDDDDGGGSDWCTTHPWVCGGEPPDDPLDPPVPDPDAGGGWHPLLAPSQNGTDDCKKYGQNGFYCETEFTRAELRWLMGYTRVRELTWVILGAVGIGVVSYTLGRLHVPGAVAAGIADIVIGVIVGYQVYTLEDVRNELRDALETQAGDAVVVKFGRFPGSSELLIQGGGEEWTSVGAGTAGGSLIATMVATYADAPPFP